MIDEEERLKNLVIEIGQEVGAEFLWSALNKGVCAEDTLKYLSTSQRSRLLLAFKVAMDSVKMALLFHMNQSDFDCTQLLEEVEVESC